MSPLSFLLVAPVQAATADSGGLTFGEVLANIPHDPASIFVYVLLVAVGLVLARIGRARPSDPPAGRD
jgi:hypothetical protein